MTPVHNIYLAFALIWLVLGTLMAIWVLDRPGNSQWMLIVGCGVLALYNLARWLMVRGRAAKTSQPSRPRPREDKPPDPIFDFSEEPPPK